MLLLRYAPSLSERVCACVSAFVCVGLLFNFKYQNYRYVLLSPSLSFPIRLLSVFLRLSYRSIPSLRSLIADFTLIPQLTFDVKSAAVLRSGVSSVRCVENWMLHSTAHLDAVGGAVESDDQAPTSAGRRHGAGKKRRRCRQKDAHGTSG